MDRLLALAMMPLGGEEAGASASVGAGAGAFALFKSAVCNRDDVESASTEGAPPIVDAAAAWLVTADSGCFPSDLLPSGPAAPAGTWRPSTWDCAGSSARGVSAPSSSDSTSTSSSETLGIDDAVT